MSRFEISINLMFLKLISSHESLLLSFLFEEGKKTIFKRINQEKKSQRFCSQKEKSLSQISINFFSSQLVPTNQSHPRG